MTQKFSKGEIVIAISIIFSIGMVTIIPLFTKIQLTFGIEVCAGVLIGSIPAMIMLNKKYGDEGKKEQSGGTIMEILGETVDVTNGIFYRTTPNKLEKSLNTFEPDQELIVAIIPIIEPERSEKEVKSDE